MRFFFFFLNLKLYRWGHLGCGENLYTQVLTNSNSLILIKNNVRPKEQQLKTVDVNCTLFWFNLNAYRKSENALKKILCQRKLNLLNI